MVASSFRHLFRGLQELCFPPACLACGQRLLSSRPPLFCSSCREGIRLLEGPLCPSCGLPHLQPAGSGHVIARSDAQGLAPAMAEQQKEQIRRVGLSASPTELDKTFPCLPCQQRRLAGEQGAAGPADRFPDHFCRRCLQGKWHFSLARAVFYYNEVTARAIHGFKYARLTTGLSTFGYFFAQARAARDIATPGCILPVPLHPKRLRERGFNQALLLARTFFPDRREVIQPFLLERHQATPPQTGLSGAVRRQNLKGAFRVTAPEVVRGKCVLLVDDVFTTGATVDECARTLLRSGAAEVQVLTLARVER